MKKKPESLDIYYMQLALAEARKAAARGEVPVGAVLVQEGRVLARGHNRPVSGSDPTAHAEIVAIRKAARKLGNYRLTGSTLYVTVEPCPMCLGAIIQARIRRLVYGAEDPKAGAVVSRLRFSLDQANHRPEISGGLGRDECGQLLKDFFRQKRQGQKKCRMVENRATFK
ncbi:MAG: tRNA adenosine(34) deaminase TadA [Candidatus Saccharicenans sp.]|nr:tRNA adenosine(34) deaminase TadA [Candidatus Saccharicenans sp.]MDH7575748.1 tRNA adenosine(34) deaminase TadA [Candidatus Saccharicenans sp.]